MYFNGSIVWAGGPQNKCGGLGLSSLFISREARLNLMAKHFERMVAHGPRDEKRKRQKERKWKTTLEQKHSDLLRSLLTLLRGENPGFFSSPLDLDLLVFFQFT